MHGLFTLDRLSLRRTIRPAQKPFRQILPFETGALAEGATVQKAAYGILSFDVGFKHRGFFFQTEFSTRWLSKFRADGPLPVRSNVDRTFYIQAAFFPIPKTLELYAATSQIYGNKKAGFGHSYEYLGGVNFYPFDERYFRVNAQVISVYKSPASSVVGFYVGARRARRFQWQRVCSFESNS